MVASVLSPSWYRVAQLKPRLRKHAEIHRHYYRGQLWYVLQDHSGGKHHRFSPAAHSVIRLMDGRRSLDEVWQLAADELGDEAPTQDEVINLLGQLHAADVLNCDVTPDTQELFSRFKKGRKVKWKQRLSSPLSVRIPLWDPERFLVRTVDYVRPLFSRAGALVWLFTIGLAIVQAGIHWNELTNSIIDQVMAPQNLILLTLVYPVVKSLHEMGHAYAVKIWGGEVHEMGVMFLVFVPVPYVDASAASSFRDNRKRMIVGGAGIIVELFLASLALFVWLNVEPGVVRAIAYNVMLIGGVSTLLFNGNPLLKFDGYHILVDALEAPNLGTRANRYIVYLLQRRLFGLRSAIDPVSAPGERFWLPFYGVSAFLYRMFIMAAIVVFVAGKFFFVGVLIALWSITALLVLPIWKALRFLFFSPMLRTRRMKTVAISATACALIAGLLFAFPAPLSTQAEGVVWLPEQSIVRAGANGEVLELLAQPDDFVEQGQPLIRLGDPFLPLRVELYESRLEELRLRYVSVRGEDLVQANTLRDKMAEASENLKEARDQLEKLIVRSPSDGKFILPDDADLPGRFLRQGDVLAYVLNGSNATARVVVAQGDQALVTENTGRVELRFAENIGEVYTVSVQRELPGATDRLPNPALGSQGGGEFLIDPRDSSGLKTFEKVFQLDVSLPPEEAVNHIGGRVYVLFKHGTEPAGMQIYRAVRQLLLRRFGV